MVADVVRAFVQSTASQGLLAVLEEKHLVVSVWCIACARFSVLWSAVVGAMTQGSRRRALPRGKYPKNENQKTGG